MPSMKCYECKKVKWCSMVMVNAGDDKVVAQYLCRPCTKETMLRALWIVGSRVFLFWLFWRWLVQVAEGGGLL